MKIQPSTIDMTNIDNVKDAAYDAAGYAISYLRKMKQWNDGKLNLAVPGYDAPHRMSNEDIEEAMSVMLALRDAV